MRSSKNSEINFRYLGIFIGEVALAIILGILAMILAFNDDIFKQYTNDHHYRWYLPSDIAKFPCNQIGECKQQNILSINFDNAIRDTANKFACFILDNTYSIKRDSIINDNLTYHLVEDICVDSNFTLPNKVLNKLRRPYNQKSILFQRKLILIYSIKLFLKKYNQNDIKIIAYDFCGADKIQMTPIINESIQLKNNDFKKNELNKFYSEIVSKILDYNNYYPVKMQWSDFYKVFDFIDSVVYYRKNYSRLSNYENSLTIISDFEHEIAGRNGGSSPYKWMTSKVDKVLTSKFFRNLKLINYDAKKPSDLNCFNYILDKGNQLQSDSFHCDYINTLSLSEYENDLEQLFSYISSEKIIKKDTIFCYAEDSTNSNDYEEYSFAVKFTGITITADKPLFIVARMIHNNIEQSKSLLLFKNTMQLPIIQDFGLNKLAVKSFKDSLYHCVFNKMKTDDDGFKLKLYYSQSNTKNEEIIIPRKRLKEDFAIIWLVGVTLFFNTIFFSFLFFILKNITDCFSIEKSALIFWPTTLNIGIGILDVIICSYLFPFKSDKFSFISYISLFIVFFLAFNFLIVWSIKKSEKVKRYKTLINIRMYSLLIFSICFIDILFSKFPFRMELALIIFDGVIFSLLFFLLKWVIDYFRKAEKSVILKQFIYVGCVLLFISSFILIICYEIYYYKGELLAINYEPWDKLKEIGNLTKGFDWYYYSNLFNMGILFSVFYWDVFKRRNTLITEKANNEKQLQINVKKIKQQINI